MSVTFQELYVVRQTCDLSRFFFNDLNVGFFMNERREFCCCGVRVVNISLILLSFLLEIMYFAGKVTFWAAAASPGSAIAPFLCGLSPHAGSLLDFRWIISL